MTFAALVQNLRKRQINDIQFHLLMSIVDIRRTHRLFAAFLLAAAVDVSAGDWQEPVVQHICSRWSDIAGSGDECVVVFPGLSPNFRLQDCPQPVSVTLLRPLQPGRNGVELGCESPWWRQNLAIQLQIFKPVVVLARAAGIDQTLGHDDISLVRHDIGSLSKEFFTAPEQVTGMKIRRNLRAGTVLSGDMLVSPQLIGRGEQVNIRVIRAGIRIEMKGTALENGKEGDRIRVRNEQSQRIVTGVVLERGLVQVE